LASREESLAFFVPVATEKESAVRSCGVSVLLLWLEMARKTLIGAYYF
jgi:hypothetical protein